MENRYVEFEAMLNNNNNKIFMIGVIVSQVIGIAMTLIVGLWLGQYQGGYKWDAKNVFNYHPLLMTIGLILFFGECKFCSNF